MSRLLASSIHSRLISSSSTNFHRLISIHHPCETLLIFVSARRNRTSVSRAMESPSSIPGSPRKMTTRAANGSGPVGSAGPGVPIPNIPIWARLVLGAVFCLALPFYKKILRIEGVVERDVETVAEAVEAVAEVTEKIAADVADAIPGNGRIKQLALEAQDIAKEVAKDSDQVEAFLHKVDEIKEEIETSVEPPAEKTKLTVGENLEKKDTKSSKDPLANP